MAMPSDFRGIPSYEAAETVMNNIKSTKSELDGLMNATKTSFSANVEAAFAGAQTEAMNGYINSLVNAIKKMYDVIDSTEKESFAYALDEAIKSYRQSDENVAASYKSSSAE